MVAPAELLVVDASVAVKWYLIDEPDADLALHLFNSFGRGEILLTAPQHIRSEVPSAITIATRATLRGQRQPRRTSEQGRQLPTS